ALRFREEGWVRGGLHGLCVTRAPLTQPCPLKRKRCPLPASGARARQRAPLLKQPCVIVWTRAQSRSGRCANGRTRGDPMRKTLCMLAACAAFPCAAAAQGLKVVEVNAPAVNCVFHLHR